MFYGYVSSVLYVVSFDGHSISKWQQLPWLRQIYLFQTPFGNSVPLGLTGLEREGVRLLLPTAVSYPVTGQWLGHTHLLWHPLPVECRAVPGLVEVQKGSTEWWRESERRLGLMRMLWSGISVQEGPGRKDTGEPGGNSVLITLFSLLFSFLLCCASPWQLGEER